jgi:hypothetical protein
MHTLHCAQLMINPLCNLRHPCTVLRCTVLRIGADSDGEGHGTHVSGTVGGRTVGVSPGVNLYGKYECDPGSFLT